MNHRVVPDPIETRVRAGWVCPICSVDLSPPWCRGHGSGVGEVVGEEQVEDERPLEPLGLGRVARAVDEGLELTVRDRVLADAADRTKGNKVLS